MAEDEAAVQLQAALAAREAAASQRITVLFGASLEDRAGFNAQVTAVREDLAALRAATRDLEVLTEEEDTEEEAQRLAAVLKGHQAEYDRLQTAFKQANIQARRNMESAVAAKRKALLSGGEAALQPGRAASQASAVATSQGVTHSLQRTRQLMTQELEHTSATLAAMDTSNERLAAGREELRSHRSLFGTSRRLLRALFTSTIWDTVSLYFGLAVFVLVCAYVLQKRTLYFAPVGKVLGPVSNRVGGTAWNHTCTAGGFAWNQTRHAAARAQALALGALQRRLQQRNHSSADQHQAGPPEQQAEGLHTPGEAQQQPPPAAEEDWAAAEPDPLADVQPAPEGPAPVPVLDDELEQELLAGNMMDSSDDGGVPDELAASEREGSPGPNAEGGGGGGSGSGAKDSATRAAAEEQLAADPAPEDEELPPMVDEGGAEGGNSNGVTAPDAPSGIDTAEEGAQPAAGDSQANEPPPAARHTTAKGTGTQHAAAEPAALGSSAAESAAEPTIARDQGAAPEDGTPVADGSDPADEPKLPGDPMVGLQPVRDEPEPSAAAPAQPAAWVGQAGPPPSGDDVQVPATGRLEREELSDAADAPSRQQKRESVDAAISSGSPVGSDDESAGILPQPAEAHAAAALQRDAVEHHSAALEQAELSEPAGGSTRQQELDAEDGAPVASDGEEQHTGQDPAATSARFVAEGGREFEWRWSEAQAAWQLYDVETQTLVHQAPPAAEAVGVAVHDEL